MAGNLLKRDRQAAGLKVEGETKVAAKSVTFSFTAQQKNLFSALSQLCRPQSPLFDVLDVMCTDGFR